MKSADPVSSTVNGQPKKFGLFQRLRGRSKRSNEVTKADQRESTPSPQPIDTSPPESPLETEVRVVTPASTSNDKPKGKRAQKSKLPFREEVKLDQAPPAREAAFSGPPRYDWIDIETSAAIKVQAAFRRNKVMREMEEQGLYTAAIRRRSRRRRAYEGTKGGESDVPEIFRWCGVGLSLMEDPGDYEEIREREKTQYEERKKEREQREAQLRSSYRRQMAANANAEDEAYEVVEMAASAEAEEEAHEVVE